jgi:hypothetical protein
MPLSAGPSEPIVRGVIEQFATRFLIEPVVLSYSDSASPVAYVDIVLMERLKLTFRPGDPLPDVLLADLAEPLRFVFVEAVATEGPNDESRVSAITRWLADCGYTAADAYYVTAYLDRNDPAFRRTIGEIAWPSAVWFVTEPERLMVALDGAEVRSLRDLPGWLPGSSRQAL